MLPDTKFCTTCLDENKTSEVGVMTEQTHDIDFCAYYDEAGKLHCHDPNPVYIVYKCTLGHIEEDKKMKVCWCGWGNESLKTKQ